ncbi:MAG: hypothetical protein Q7V43_11870 [Myxococcales bacterium]|nr:hypothetical protein [Myxococcales bacterium]
MHPPPGYVSHPPPGYGHPTHHPAQAPAPPHAAQGSSTALRLVIILLSVALGVAATVAFLALSKRDRKEPAQARVVPVTPVAPTAPAAPAAPAAPLGAAPPAARPATAGGDERVLTTNGAHGFTFPLMFHYAHIGGVGIADVHGHLDHPDGHYFQLGPGDSLTLEAPDGQEFVSDGTIPGPDLEVIVHPHDRAASIYEVDVSHAHLDVNGPWVELGTTGAHDWDIDHVVLRSARYVRIRNVDAAQSVYLDAVYVRRLQPCTNVARCRDVNHLVPRR